MPPRPAEGPRPPPVPPRPPAPLTRARKGPTLTAGPVQYSRTQRDSRRPPRARTAAPPPEMRPAGAAPASRALAQAGHALTRTGARRRQRRARAPRFCVTERPDETSSVGGAVPLPAQQLSFCLGASPWPHVPGRGVGLSGSQRERRAPPRLADSLRGGAGVCACALGACAREGLRPAGGADSSRSQPGLCRVWRVAPAPPSLGRRPPGGRDGGGGPAGWQRRAPSSGRG